MGKTEQAKEGKKETKEGWGRERNEVERKRVQIWRAKMNPCMVYTYKPICIWNSNLLRPPLTKTRQNHAILAQL